MMSKKQIIKIDAQNWRAKLQEHPLEIEGALIRFRSKAALMGDSDELTLTLAQWARLWGVDEDNAKRIIEYIITEGLAESNCETFATGLCNNCVTLAVRFLAPEEKAVVEEKAATVREQTRIRVARSRENKRRAAQGLPLLQKDEDFPPADVARTPLLTPGATG